MSGDWSSITSEDLMTSEASTPSQEGSPASPTSHPSEPPMSPFTRLFDVLPAHKKSDQDVDLNVYIHVALISLVSLVYFLYCAIGVVSILDDNFYSVIFNELNTVVSRVFKAMLFTSVSTLLWSVLVTHYSLSQLPESKLQKLRVQIIEYGIDVDAIKALEFITAVCTLSSPFFIGGLAVNSAIYVATWVGMQCVRLYNGCH